MKKSSSWFKGIFSFLTVMGLSVVLTHAQSDNPSWTVSKDVQKVANKRLFKSEELRESHINAEAVGYPQHVVSKDVQKRSPAVSEAKGNVVSKGYPYWTLSKGVHRTNRK